MEIHGVLSNQSIIDGHIFHCPTKHRSMKQKYEAKDLQALVDVGSFAAALRFVSTARTLAAA
jgi:hypothetical protein